MAKIIRPHHRRPVAKPAPAKKADCAPKAPAKKAPADRVGR
jgi:hypothetical protein